MVMLYTIAQGILITSYTSLEEEYTRLNVLRAMTAASGELSALGSIAVDWAEWGDTYAFIEDGSPEYITTNLHDRTFQQLKLNLIISLIAASLLIGAVTMFLLEKLILSRLARLSQEVSNIGTGGKLVAAVTVSGSDELSALAHEINQMLETLDRSQKRLRDSEERYRTFVEQSSETIWRFELEQPVAIDAPEDEQVEALRQHAVLSECNDAMAHMYGYQQAEEAIGSRLGDMVIRSGLRSALNLHNFVRSGYRLSNMEIEITDSKGRRNTLLYNIVGIIRDEHVIRLWGIERNITELKHLQEQLLRAQRLETAGRIAGQVAHDFNNLLGPVVAYPELIKLQLPKEHPAVGYCDAILEAADRMAAINDDLMTLGRRGLIDHQSVDINSLVLHALSQIENQRGELEITTDLPNDIPLIQGSPAQLLRVISNLVSNAREAMSDRGQLTIRTERIPVDRLPNPNSRVELGDYVRLTIKDTGCGIPPEIRSKIFDAFFTTKTSSRRRGCGLGLSIVQSIIIDHNGFLDLESAVGQGTTFYIYLPVSTASTSPQGRATLLGGNETILVVDDDSIHREAVGELLRRLQYRVKTAGCGEEALELVRELRPQLLVLDMVMPGMDGLETYRQVQKVRPGQRAVLLSGFSETDRIREAQKLGAGNYLRKPITLFQLAVMVRQELDRRN